MELKFEKPKANGYTIYSKSGCPNCTKVKKYLTDVNAAMSIIDCDEYLIESKEEFLKFIEDVAGKVVKIFPIVFFEKKLVGGYEDTEYHYNRITAFSHNVFF
jgi:glutaredoxin